MQKKVLFIGIGILLITIIGGIWFFQPKTNNQPATDTFPKVINSRGDQLLFENDQFSITFISDFKTYEISIFSSPFPQIRAAAEQEFLKVLTIDKNQACGLLVSISTLDSINPNYAGQPYPLSFCEQPSPTPQLTINPQAQNLSLLKIEPKPGKITYANTVNAITVTFSVPVNPQTAVATVSPALSVNATVRADDLTSVLINPQSAWKENTTYTITLKAGLTSADGVSQLKEDITNQYEMVKPDLPPASEPETN